MDDPNQRRAKHDASMHPSADPRYHQSLQQQHPSQRRGGGYGPATTAADRYRASSMTASPASGGRGMGGSTGYGGYYQEPSAGAFSTPTALPQSNMGYHQPAADYGQDTRQQAQNFTSAYNPAGILYNVQQASAQAPVYDTSQQFSARQPAAMQMMAADVASPYFQGGQGGSGVPSSAMQQAQQQAASSNTSASVYQQSPAGRSALMQGYQNAMPSIEGLASQQASAADVSMEDQEYPATGSFEAAYTSYQAQLKEVYQSILDGALETAGESLLSVSEWLLGHVTELGLTTDDQNLYSDRIKLWDEFNVAWLGLFQAQKNHDGVRPAAAKRAIIDKSRKLGKDGQGADTALRLHREIWTCGLSVRRSRRKDCSCDGGMHEPLRQQWRGSLWERCWFKFSLMSREQAHPTIVIESPDTRPFIITFWSLLAILYRLRMHTWLGVFIHPCCTALRRALKHGPLSIRSRGRPLKWYFYVFLAHHIGVWNMAAGEAGLEWRLEDTSWQDTFMVSHGLF